MSERFISNVALAIAGAVVVVASQAFSSTVTGWLTFGVSLGVLALLAVVQRDRARGRLQRLLDIRHRGPCAVVGGGLCRLHGYDAHLAVAFCEAIGFVGLVVVGLVAHELKTERIVHQFEAIPAEARDGRRSEFQAAA